MHCPRCGSEITEREYQGGEQTHVCGEITTQVPRGEWSDDPEQRAADRAVWERLSRALGGNDT